MRSAHSGRLHVRFGYLRLVLAGVAAYLAWLAFGRDVLSGYWIAVPIVGFYVVASYHSRILARHRSAERACAFYAHGLARIEDRWIGTGATGERFMDPDHIYAADLDLFGDGGLFQLLCTARTRMGEDTLAAWLLSPADPAEVRERQAAVAELRDKVDLREDLAVTGEDEHIELHGEALQAWAEAPNHLWPKQWQRALALLLTLGFLASLFVWYRFGTATPAIALLVLEALLAFRLREEFHNAVDGAEHAFEDLKSLSSVLARLEAERSSAAKLQTLSAFLSQDGVPASRAIAKLSTIVDLIMSRDHMLLRVLDIPLLYTFQVAFLAEDWRHKFGPCVRRWLSALGELEALISFSAYLYEHPADSFPQFQTGTACFDGEELGHPLIPATRCVRNSVLLCERRRVLLVSGSNMSGKSTLLRTVGLSAVLAMAGAPVRARSLRLSPLQTGASIRINDSLQEGSSRFYAEIKRLRRIVTLARESAGALFLIDEILQGTNSKDRRTGAEGVIRELIGSGAIGLFTTHDLALTEISLAFGDAIANAHFQDEIQNGKICFDYQLREGVVTKSNGLELMRSIGLDV